MAIRIVQCVLLVGAIVASSIGHACSCIPSPEDRRERVISYLDDADLVFLGIVESLRVFRSANGDLVQDAVFIVRKAWKGDTENRVTTRTTIQCCMCGKSFELGGSYLVYATDWDGDGYPSDSTCSGTSFEAEAAEDIEILDGLGHDHGT